MSFQDFFTSIQLNSIDQALLIASGLFIVISWLYYFLVFSKVKLSAKTELNQKLPGVSIVIAARDAKKHLIDNIPLWLKQDYPEFEIVIANDRSSDGSTLFLTEQANQHPQLKIVQLDIDVVKTGGKKLALTLALKKAKYQYFVLTDADCKPASDQWLRGMVNGFAQGYDIVLGVSPLNTRNGFLGRLIHYENTLTALSYLGLCLQHKTYMGVGRNLAYTRKAYDSVSGFSSHYHIPAGDDDLFVQEACKKNATGVYIHPDAYTHSAGPATWKQYWKQKQRHLWVGKNYLSNVKFQLFWFPFSQLAFYLLIGFWFFNGTHLFWPLLMIFIKWIPEWIIFGLKAKLFKMPKATPIYPIINVFHAFWYSITGIFALFKKKIVW
jgi:cellulose synthase/poly-beta-1,6-N-acetylglucosamine synthase-like glycosyltransferase